MRDLVVVDGDRLALPPLFGNCTVSVTNPIIRAHHGGLFIKGKRVCVLKDADRKTLKLAATYFQGAFVTLGTGEVTLQVNSAAQRSYVQGEPLLLKGDTFTAVFTVQMPAMNPVNGTPDQTKEVTTTGSFQPSQFFVHAS